MKLERSGNQGGGREINDMDIKTPAPKTTHGKFNYSSYPSLSFQTKLWQADFDVHSESHLLAENPVSSVFPFDNLTSAVPLIDVSTLQVNRGDM